MSEILSIATIHQAVGIANPTLSQDPFLTAAQFLGRIYIYIRKGILAKNNPVEFAVGSAISFANIPGIEQLARITFGLISVIRCSEALHKINKFNEKCDQILASKSYVVIKGDQFSSSWIDQISYGAKVRHERMASYFETVIEIIKVFCELILCMGDAYIAYNEECTSEVFIHGTDLWNELTSNSSYLVTELKKNENVNDWIFGKMENCTWKTDLLMGVITLPVQVTSFIEAATETVTRAYERKTANGKKNLEACQSLWDELNGIEPELQYNLTGYQYKPGEPGDPELTRIITPPRRNQYIKILDSSEIAEYL